MKVPESSQFASSCRQTASRACGDTTWRTKRSVPKAFLEQAENAARQLGDDAMQLKLKELGETVPDAFEFGTSDQRVTWFRRGFYGGKFGDCDTFSDPY